MTLTLVIIAYLVGSIPFGLIGKHIFKIEDPRTFGSKNIGATNILRSGSKSAALFTLTLDMGKGLIIIISAEFLQMSSIPVVAIAVVLGHIFPIYLFFRGGKGVATFFGVLIGLNIICGALTLLSWLLVFLFFKKSSLAALCSIALSNFFLFFLYPFPLTQIAILFVSVIVLWKHKENIKRMINKEELTFENLE